MSASSVEPMNREEMLSMRGSGWEGNLDEIRGSAPIHKLPPPADDVRPTP